jgi:hypothetical protein
VNPVQVIWNIGSTTENLRRIHTALLDSLQAYK